MKTLLAKPDVRLLFKLITLAIQQRPITSCYTVITETIDRKL